MFHIFEQRKTQLKQQEKIDNVLLNLKKDCSDFVAEYLLIHRDISRKQQDRIINSKFWKVYDETQNQLNENQKTINHFLENVSCCNTLKDILNKN